jgi:integrase/recombinase XerD
MNSYEQTLRLFEKWCWERFQIENVDQITESVVRRYINDLMERGKYSFYTDDKRKNINYPERRRDFGVPYQSPQSTIIFAIYACSSTGWSAIIYW